MKWRIIGTDTFRGKIYVQITNDIDVIDYVPVEELPKYNLKLKNKEVKK